MSNNLQTPCKPIYMWMEAFVESSVSCRSAIFGDRFCSYFKGVMAFRVEFITTIIALLMMVPSQATNIETSGSVSSGLSYWQKKLPTTPIPNTLLAKLSSEQTQGFLSLKDIQDDRASVSVVKSPRKIGGHIHKPNLSNSPGSASSIRHHNYTAISKGHHAHKDSTAVPIFIYSGSHEVQDQMRDALFMIYFLEKSLRSHTKVTMDLAILRSPESRIHFLPRTVADEIPFSSDKLSVSLEKLNIPRDSEMAFAMEETLAFCEDSAMTGETKYCATSLESLIDHTTSKLGTNDVSVLVTNLPQNSNSGKQQYTITNSFPFQSKSSSRIVLCHTTTYAYSVYFCHELNGTRIFQVSLKGEGEHGEGSSTAELIAVCHEDTSAWDPENTALKMFNEKPGGEAICHFMPEDHIVWLPAKQA